MKDPKLIFALASFFIAIAVAAGAFGAHGLKNTLSAERLDTWEIAVRYHVWHALGLFVVGLIAAHFQIDLNWVALLMTAGILIFSGSLYTLCLSGMNWLGAITPIGGVAFIAAWLLLGYRMLKM